VLLELSRLGKRPERPWRQERRRARRTALQERPFTFGDQQAPWPVGRRVRGVGVHQPGRGVGAIVVRVARLIEQNVPYFVCERKGCPIRPQSAAIFDDDVPDRPGVAKDERLADPTSAGEARDEEDLERRGVAVVKG